MKHGADVTGVLAWGLRRFAWLVALFVVVLGVVVPGLLTQGKKEFQATAQVGPTQALKLPNVDVLPKLATSVFDNVRTHPRVKAAAGVRGAQSVSLTQLELVAGQDNIVFAVVARGTDPLATANLANVASNVFVDELNVYGQSVGSFSVGHLAETPSDPLPTLGGPVAWAIGIASGLLLGCGAVALLLLVRRPVIDGTTAELESGAPVLGRITLARSGTGATGMTQLCHRIVSQPTRMVLMAGPPGLRRERHELADELVFWLSRVRRVIAIGSREPVEEFGAASLAERTAREEELVIISDASPVDVATRPERSLTLLVVREGISRSALQEQARQYVDSGSVAMVLVTRATLLQHLRHRRAGRGAGRAGASTAAPRRSAERPREAQRQDRR